MRRPGPGQGTMASRPLLAVYVVCHASKQMCSSARWALRYARPQADIHAIHSRMIPKCGCVPMARSCGYRSEYDAQGQRINKGMRLDENGILTALHTTGERVEDQP